ncbi:MAG: hypothetical protein LBQ12_13185 [Deltaproteobacteria bacterium]|jgi:hypothetical protein|nr:hypothetical protein [Deltaproteobacteria bacterium]
MARSLIQFLAGIHYSDSLDAGKVPLVSPLVKIISKIFGGDSLESPDESKEAKLADKLLKEKGESYCRSLLKTCLRMVWAKVTPEKPEVTPEKPVNSGPPGLEVVCVSLTYVVMELKISENAKGAARAARDVMDQIRRRGYAGASETPVLVSLAVGKAERNIVGCLFMGNGGETALMLRDGTCVTPPSPGGAWGRQALFLRYAPFPLASFGPPGPVSPGRPGALRGD